MTTEQPILDELHAIREKLLADSGGTLAGLVARLQREQQSSNRIIRKTGSAKHNAKPADVPLPVANAR